MSNDASFIGTIPEHYDRGLGPVIFADYAADIARRAAAGSPARVLEIAAGTGIVIRQLRDLLPAGADLTATDLNPPMLEVARAKFRPEEQVDFRPADATALPFRDCSFDAVVCQFGVMFFYFVARREAAGPPGLVDRLGAALMPARRSHRRAATIIRRKHCNDIDPSSTVVNLVKQCSILDVWE